ncbi:hypothetical protein PU629_05890 [Pullulanibacillus sp. KACC 23026]|uniref:sporulation membrane protein YtrI n=1 Tax=Pullulanibacillus sp. KACC 23026 TaxID=3028315 RepID=UPI0023AFC7FD|nr:sporulation membrane protein YtrI [Pullulanibacillus sp. KACC 23026]WEG13896.1 hypothetical protein PU629_05890 [Pullulanibacillus sp. KACC 23026]
MRVPPYYRDPSWQRFFAGIIIGAIIGFGFFIYINGEAQERQLLLINQQKKTIEDLEDQNKVLLEKSETQNEDLQKELTIQEIKVTVETTPNIKLDGLKKIDLIDQIKDQLRPIIGNDIESVAKNQALIFNLINDHPFVIENNVYQVQVQSVVIFSNLEVQVKVIKQTQT